MVVFTPEEKIRYFDEIEKRFFCANFGQMSKSNIDLLFFHFYLQTLIDRNRNKDGIIDFKKCSDYSISKDLGLTESQVRNLKIKSQLLYPIDYDWKKAFALLLERARYDEMTKKVIISIPDPNLYIEIQNFMEENGAHIEKQLNNKLLQMRVEFFLDLIYALESEENKKKIKKRTIQYIKEHNKDEEILDKKQIGKAIIEAGVNITEIVANISGWVSPANFLMKPLQCLLGM